MKIFCWKTVQEGNKITSGHKSRTALNAPKALGKKVRGPVFSLKRAVAEAYELFPKFKDRIFFIDLDTNKVVHPDPAIRSQLIDLMNSNDELREVVNIEKHMARMNRTSFCMEIAANGHTIRFMALYLKKDMQNIFGKDHPLSKTRFSIFDHELAHAVIPEARAQGES